MKYLLTLTVMLIGLSASAQHKEVMMKDTEGGGSERSRSKEVRDASTSDKERGNSGRQAGNSMEKDYGTFQGGGNSPARDAMREQDNLTKEHEPAPKPTPEPQPKSQPEFRHNSKW